MLQSPRTYLPAAGRDWSLPLYDPIVTLLGGNAARRVLLEQAALRQGHRVLDIGCGTGTLAALIKRLHPDIEVVGLDPDPKALARARRKAARAAVSIPFNQGFGDELPYPNASFDRVFSSFMFHHLPTGEKGRTLCEVRRVLKSSGSLHMLDFEGPEDGVHGFLARLLRSSHRLKDNSAGRVLSLMSQAGFADPKKVGRQRVLFGRIAYYRASVASSRPALPEDTPPSPWPRW
jgi:ubiquinone/menaquinone biosynthesis C-methylase UbiE